MWCPSCRADVAAELSKDNRRMLCARCQCELGVAAAALPPVISTRTVETERDARELLARWSAQNLLEAPAPAANTYHRPEGHAEAMGSRSELRFDAPRSGPSGPSGRFMAAFNDKRSAAASGGSEQTNEPDRPARKKKKREAVTEEPIVAASPQVAPARDNSERTSRITELPEPVESLPHEYVAQEPLPHPGPPKANWSTLAGQLCAYGGVALLTCGTVLVMWSYFGGPASYMPTGWLTAAVGQMLLFLGVITLISSGMEQTVAEVAWRIDHLAAEVHNMGLALDDLEDEQRLLRLERARAKKRRRRADPGTAREAA